MLEIREPSPGMQANRAARVTMLVNTQAGTQSTTSIERLVELFREAGTEPTVLTAKSGTELLDLARGACHQAATLVAAGGDGTVNAVATAIAGSETALGVLPLGTLNHFAKD